MENSSCHWNLRRVRLGNDYTKSASFAHHYFENFWVKTVKVKKKNTVFFLWSVKSTSRLPQFIGIERSNFVFFHRSAFSIFLRSTENWAQNRPLGILETVKFRRIYGELRRNNGQVMVNVEPASLGLMHLCIHPFTYLRSFILLWRVLAYIYTERACIVQ